MAPRFAVPVLLAPDRSFLVPAPAAAARRATAGTGAALGPAAPRESGRRVLAVPRSRDDEKGAKARRELLSGCPEVTSASGRFLWPVVALDEASRGLVEDPDNRGLD